MPSDQLQQLNTALSDRYRVERELGQGGMATVYLAHDLRHDRKVALKVLRPELSAILGGERFLHEIKTTANLQHPHILPLFDSGAVKDDGQPSAVLYYVMPFVEGESLRARLTREKHLPVNDAVRIATEAASALDYAHRHGVIHRDIKPENILLHDGSALVADFGIALAVSTAGGGSRMTEAGMSLGTPQYMAPEQAVGEREIGPGADIYALGATTYEMLTGEPPFTGPSAQAIMARMATETPRPLGAQRATVPPNVEAAVLTALQLLPADRFASAKAFAEALVNPAFAHRSPAPGHALPSHVRRLKLAAIAAGCVALGCAGLALWAWRRPVPSHPILHYPIALPDSQAPWGPMVLSPDGARLVYVGSNTHGGSQLWAWSRNQDKFVPIPGTDDPQGAFTISPDGQWVALVQNHVLSKVPIAGGPPVILAHSALPTGIAWLDDRNLVFADNDVFSLRRVSQGGGDDALLWQPPQGQAPVMMNPLPRARGVLFTLCGGPCTRSSLYVFDMNSGTTKLLVEDALKGFYLPTGHLIYVMRDGAVRAVSFDLAKLETHGIPVDVLNDVYLFDGRWPLFTVSASGTLVMRTDVRPTQVQRGNTDLVWVNRTGIVVPVDPSWTFQLGQTRMTAGWALSPDGQQLVIGGNTESGDDVWLRAMPHGPMSHVSSNEATDSSDDYHPRWRDEKTVSYIRIPGRTLVQRRADGIGSEDTVMAGPVMGASWSRDGMWLVADTGGANGRHGARDIVGMRPGLDSVLRPLVADSRYDEAAAELSPDGKWLAYQSDETGRMEIQLRPFPNTNAWVAQVSKGGGSMPLWARSGRELFYVDDNRNMMVVSVMGGASPGLGEPRTLFRINNDLYLSEDEPYTAFDISPDDRQFLMVRQQSPFGGGRANILLVENWFEELRAKMESGAVTP